MPVPHVWTPDEDATLRTMREHGIGWESIGRALCMSKQTVIKRARVHGMPYNLPREKRVVDAVDRNGRQPLGVGCAIDLNAGLPSRMSGV